MRSLQTSYLFLIGLLLAILAGDAVAQDADHLGAIVIFPYVVVDAAADKDTLLQLTNGSSSITQVRCLYENYTAHCSNGPTVPCRADSDCGGGTCVAGYNVTDFRIQLTRSQPIGWRASSGLAVLPCSQSGACPGDDGSIPAAPSDPFFGSLTCLVVDQSDMPLPNNALRGSATIETLRTGDGSVDVARYGALGFPANPDLFINGTSLPLGGSDAPYAGCAETNSFAHFLDGTIDPITQASRIITTLVLLPCSRDPLQSFQPGHATVQLTVINEFEQTFTTFTTVDGWLAKRLSDIQPNIFSAGTMGSTAAQTRISSSPGGVMAIAIEERTSLADPQRVTSTAASPHIQGARAAADYLGPALPTTPVCGNFIVEPGEICDGGECCTANCDAATGDPCSDDSNACTTDVCDAQAVCTHPPADPLPTGCGCCQVAVSASPLSCAGDCDGDGVVTDLELQLCLSDPGACPSCDVNGDFFVSPAEARVAEANLANGCPRGLSACAAPLDQDTCAAEFGGIVRAGAECARGAAGADAFGCAVTTPILVSGTCRQPGPLGLAGCTEGTVVTISRCNNASCNPANLTLLASSQTDADGNFSMALPYSEAAGFRLLFAAHVTAASLRTGAIAAQLSPTDYRIIDFGPIAAGGRLDNVILDPVSEASTRLLTQRKLEDFSNQAIIDVIDFGRAANVGNDFAGQSPEDAVATAMQTDLADPTFQSGLANSRPFCLGDCTDQRQVTVANVLVMMKVALGQQDLVACVAGNQSLDVNITVEELVSAVNSARLGCPK